MEPITADAIFRLVTRATEGREKYSHDLILTHKQWELLRVINGKHSLQELARLRRQDLEEITRTVAQLLHLGIIERVIF